MRGYIKLWGKEYLLDSVNWFGKSKGYAIVSFTDENGSLKVIHNKHFDYEADAEHNRYAEMLHSDLQKTVIWKEK